MALKIYTDGFEVIVCEPGQEETVEKDFFVNSRGRDRECYSVSLVQGPVSISSRGLNVESDKVIIKTIDD